MRDTPYVALHSLRWGEGWLEPGQPVPFEEGRDYQGMAARGEIAAQAEALADGQPEFEPDVLVIQVRPGDPVRLVGDGGLTVPAEYLGLGERDGQVGARVRLSDGEEALARLEMVQPPRAAQALERAEAALREAQGKVSGLEGALDEAMAHAVSLEGELDAANARVTSLENTPPPEASRVTLEQLVPVPGVNEALARKILAALYPKG